jgi:hypothetical protein
LIVRAVIAARSADTGSGLAADAAWTALPGLLALALLAYSLVHASTN